MPCMLLLGMSITCFNQQNMEPDFNGQRTLCCQGVALRGRQDAGALPEAARLHPCARARRDLRVPEASVPATVMKHIFESLTVRASSGFVVLSLGICRSELECCKRCNCGCLR